MGIYNRDYIREQPHPTYSGGGGGAADGAMAKRIVIVTVAVFVLQLLAGREQVVTRWLDLQPVATIGGLQIWRMLTYALCHDVQTPFHILFNMLLVWMFGRQLEAMYGSREFLLIYIGGALAAAAMFVGLAYLLGRPNPAVGASGAVMALMMLYARHFPRNVIRLFGVIPIEVRWLVLMYVVYDLMPVLSELSGRPSVDGVAHSAHLGGLAFGFCYGHFHWRLEKLLPGGISSWRLPRRRGDLKVYHPPEESRRGTSADDPAAISARVDLLLAQIHERGEASLTDEERAFLNEASRRYRNRMN